MCQLIGIDNNRHFLEESASAKSKSEDWHRHWHRQKSFIRGSALAKFCRLFADSHFNPTFLLMYFSMLTSNPKSVSFGRLQPSRYTATRCHLTVILYLLSMLTAKWRRAAAGNRYSVIHSRNPNYHISKTRVDPKKDKNTENHNTRKMNRALNRTVTRRNASRIVTHRNTSGNTIGWSQLPWVAPLHSTF